MVSLFLVYISDPTRIYFKQFYRPGSNGMILCMSATVSSWYFNDTEMIPTNVQILSNSNSLYMTNISENNEGKYECKGKTEDGEVFFADAFVIVEFRGDQNIFCI